jgi:type I restriction enzyme S subunit
MAKYQKYAEYKDSGLEWLGEIPSHWKIASLRFLVEAVSNGSTASQVEESETTVPISRIESISTGEIDMNKVGFVDIKTISQNFKLHKNDILLSHINSLPMVGNIALKRDDSTLFHGMNLLRLVPNRTITAPYYLFWLLKSIYFRKSVESVAKPAINQASVSIDSLKNIKLLVPNIDEQLAIANFLDHETTKIDHLIEKQQKLIELLKEKRQAVISHAVTKGLDPNVPMKDSGVEWLGEVPEHWKIIKGGYIGTLFGSESIQEDDVTDQGSLPFIKVSSLSAETFKLSNIDWFVSERRAKFCKAEKNYIVFPKRGAAIFTNKVNVIEVDSVIDPNLMGWKIGKQGITEYFALLLKTRGLDDIADVSTVPQINNKHIAPEKFPLPALSEQCEIVKFVGMELTKFDEMILKAESAIQLMQERRTALISAAVTGKIDVRNWQAPTDAEAQTELSA